nr:uncharacterized protein LOC105343383 [Crassostrea gigas]
MASRPEVLSAQQYLKVVKEVLLDRSSCPQQHSPVIRKRLPGGKRPLSSDEESDNEDDNSEVKSSSSCEGTSKIKKEPEVFPQQEMDKEADSGSDVEIIGEEWPNKCQVKKEKVLVSSQTQTDDCEPFNDGVRQSPSFPGIFCGIQFCIFGDKKGTEKFGQNAQFCIDSCRFC